MTDGIGDTFQRQTKYYRDNMPGGMLDWDTKPDIYKSYPDSDTIELPSPGNLATMSLHDAIQNRRSIRTFSDEPLTPEQLSYLLWASTGIQRIEDGYEFRTAPSAGALYPIETYLVVNNITGIKRGVYHYNIKRHILEQLAEGNFCEKIRLASLYQEMAYHAPVVFVWTAVFYRSKWKYDQRAYRYIYLDAGHIAENLALAATALELGSCQIGALFDEEVNAILNIDGSEESVLYMSVVGTPES